ncbi:MAG: two-component sensor histidine kinase [Chloroflexota bacterium]|nr:MAG: two-component sensor histidine kinase [Chloroflexota bacterium]
MSIRLRLTLLYSLILALTLVIFSVILYVTQARTTLNDTKEALAGRAKYLIEGPLAHGYWDKALKPDSSRIGTFTQIRDLDGRVLGYSPNLADDAPALPLDETALQAAQQGQVWVEIAAMDTERLFIHNQPFNFGADSTPLILQVAASLAEQDQNLSTLGRILIIGSSIAVIAAFGIGWLLAGVALRPINRLRQTAQAIGVERDFNRRVDYHGPNDEIGQLVTTFNDMLVELQAAYVQVEETLQTQRRFVADASHELRTPLTTLRGNIGLLQRRPPINAEDRADVLDDMVVETERLMRLVNDLLALARADAGRSLSQEPIQLKPLLEDVCQQVKLLAPERSIVCQASFDAAVMGDDDALKQVLLVLLDNALKYTPAETTITLATHLNNGDVSIQVSDDGPGIASVHLPHLFDRFYRGDTARSSPGAGLGLAIAEELVKAQNGVITVESRVGHGSTFILTFPRHSTE